MLSVEKVATPFTAVAVNVPLKVPLLGFVPIASVIWVVLSVVMVFPPTSCTATLTAGLLDAPDPALVGCWVNTTFVAAPAVMLKVLLIGLVKPVVEALSR